MKLSDLKKFYAIIFLTLVVMISVGFLGLTYSLTEEQIKRQEHEQALAYLSQMFPGMDNFEFENDIYTLYNNENLEGYAFIASTSGYSGEIKIMVGLADKENIKGIIIVSQTETPGIGTRITEPPFISQFDGMAINLIISEADTLTGATISSSAVIEAISRIAKEKVALIE
jgi:electron transport complex protein RnfG